MRTPLTYYGADGECFWRRVARSAADECWPWTGCTNEKGYGVVGGPNRTTRKAHRIAWELTTGAPPEDCLLHECDNPACCNPAHLVPGSRAQNNADMRARGREQRGERHHRARLTAADARAIRERYLVGGTTQRVLAAEYGVGQQTVSALLRGQTWSNA